MEVFWSRGYVSSFAFRRLISFAALAAENFKETFPGGFYGEKYNHHEREYKLKGHSLMVSSLDKEGFDSLLASNYLRFIHRLSD